MSFITNLPVKFLDFTAMSAFEKKFVESDLCKEFVESDPCKEFVEGDPCKAMKIINIWTPVTVQEGVIENKKTISNKKVRNFVMESLLPGVQLPNLQNTISSIDSIDSEKEESMTFGVRVTEKVVGRISASKSFQSKMDEVSGGISRLKEHINTLNALQKKAEEKKFDIENDKIAFEKIITDVNSMLQKFVELYEKTKRKLEEMDEQDLGLLNRVKSASISLYGMSITAQDIVDKREARKSANLIYLLAINQFQTVACCLEGINKGT